MRDALDSYEADLKVRSGDTGNVGRVRCHVPDRLLDKPVASLTSHDLRKWRDGLLAMLAPATVNRTCAAFKAALNLIATDSAQPIIRRQAWQSGLASIPDAEESRNGVLEEDIVRRIIVEAHKHSTAVGHLVEVAAVTGARISQIARLQVRDLQADRLDPRLMMPTSRKGRGKKTIREQPVPMPTALARRLADAAQDRPETAPLLTKPVIGRWHGGPWKKSDHDRPFEAIVERCGLADWEQLGYPAKVTIYALRHSSIVRQIKANVPIRIIAVNHDTSVAKIESNYSRYIGDHTDALTRAALLDTAEPTTGNMVPIRA